jgi:hypothetical protein
MGRRTCAIQVIGFRGLCVYAPNAVIDGSFGNSETPRDWIVSQLRYPARARVMDLWALGG